MTATVKRHPDAFAVRGGIPAYREPLPVGQMNFPSWERYEAAMRGVIERHGRAGAVPLADELEARLTEFFAVRHVVLVTNATIGLVMAAKALGLRGGVVVPSFTFIASAQALTWAGLEPVFCDVDPSTHQVTVETVGRAS